MSKFLSPLDKVYIKSIDLLVTLTRSNVGKTGILNVTKAQESFSHG